MRKLKQRAAPLDYVERGHMPGAKLKYMCTRCFRVFAKRVEGDGITERCTCGNDVLVRLDPEVPIPKKKASNATWRKFFEKNFMSAQSATYYKEFKLRRQL